MKRIHLFEFEDMSWFPSFLRNYMTDFLQFLTNASKLFRPSVSVLEDMIRKTGHSDVIDLGSGAGGGLTWLIKEVQKKFPEVAVTLTDLFPNLDAMEKTASKVNHMSYVSQPVDARHVPSELKGIRTQFLSFHHFDREDAIQILQNSVDAGMPIAIFEGQERSVSSFLAMLFSPVSVLFTTPFIKPFRIGRLVFTYLIPLVPIFVCWDGIVSCLRTYSVVEMNQLISCVNGQDTYQWNVGRLKSGPGINLYLTGIPKIMPD